MVEAETTPTFSSVTLSCDCGAKTSVALTPRPARHGFASAVTPPAAVARPA
jgi:hypothetical protein